MARTQGGWLGKVKRSERRHSHIEHHVEADQGQCGLGRAVDGAQFVAFANGENVHRRGRCLRPLAVLSQASNGSGRNRMTAQAAFRASRISYPQQLSIHASTGVGAVRYRHARVAAADGWLSRRSPPRRVRPRRVSYLSAIHALGPPHRLHHKTGTMNT